MWYKYSYLKWTIFKQIYFVTLLTVVFRLSSMRVGVRACMCVQVYTCVWLWVNHGYVCMHVCVHIRAKTYLHGNHLFFPAIIKCRWQIKVDWWLKNFYHHTFEDHSETHCLSFLRSVWVAESLGIEMFPPTWIYIYQSVTKEGDKRLMQNEHRSRGSDKGERIQRDKDWAVFSFLVMGTTKPKVRRPQTVIFVIQTSSSH